MLKPGRAMYRSSMSGSNESRGRPAPARSACRRSAPTAGSRWSSARWRWERLIKTKSSSGKAWPRRQARGKSAPGTFRILSCRWVGRRTTFPGGLTRSAAKAGAIIATGHEHSYSRTHLMDNFATQKFVKTPVGPLVIRKGRTFAFVSGLGGASVRVQKRGDAWWAATYTKNPKRAAWRAFLHLPQRPRE